MKKGLLGGLMIFIASICYAQTYSGDGAILKKQLTLNGVKITSIINDLATVSSNNQLATAKAIKDYIAAYGGGGGGSSSIYTSNGTITDAERVVSGSLTNNLVFDNFNDLVFNANNDYQILAGNQFKVFGGEILLQPNTLINLKAPLKIDIASKGLRKVLMSDANGNATWKDLDTVGVAADKDFIIRRNGVTAGKFKSTSVGLSTNSLFSETTGVGNTGVGSAALYSTTTGSYNAGFGYNAGGYVTTQSGQMFFNTMPTASYFGDTSYSPIFIQNRQGNPFVITDQRIKINGDLIINNASKGAGKVLTSDANGKATWQTPTGGGSIPNIDDVLAQAGNLTTSRSINANGFMYQVTGASTINTNAGVMTSSCVENVMNASSYILLNAQSYSYLQPYQGRVVIGSLAAVPSSVFTVDNTSMGSIPSPVQTSTQRNSITSPTQGLQSFDSNLKRPMWYDGTNWLPATYTHTGTAAPTIIPMAIGDKFIDTANKKIYFATGTASSADWTIVN